MKTQVNSILGLFFSLLLIVNTSYATTINYQTNNLHGYIIQSYVKSSGNPYLTNNTIEVSFDFTTVGLYLNLPLNPHFQVNLLGLSNRLGEINNGEPRFEIAELQYTTFHKTTEFVIKRGRSATPYGFFNQTRTVSGLIPGVRLPTTIYFTGIEDVMLSADGISVFSQISTSAGLLELDAYYGQHQVTSKSYTFQTFEQNIPGQYQPLIKKGYRLLFVPNQFDQFKLAYSYLQLSSQFNGPNPEFSSLDFSHNNHLLSLAIQKRYWTLTSEVRYAQARGKLNNSTNEGFNTLSYYIQGQYSPTERFTYFLTFEDYIRDDAKARTPDNYYNAVHADLRWHLQKNIDYDSWTEFI